MKFLRGVIGYAYPGLFVALVWGDYVKAYGIAGGLVACTLIISILWYMNHYLGLIKFDDNSGFIDMGLGIGVCLFLKQAFIEKSVQPLANGLPTLICVMIGAIIGGFVAGIIEKDFMKDETQKIKDEKAVEFKELEKENV
ncbi:hypothetical protein UT300005_12590 [Clostridium sp. CTA-5]